jgi:hypothetical protein
MGVMARRKAYLLAGLTIWPFLFPLLGWLSELLGLIPISSPQPPPAFIIFMGMLWLTVIEILALLVFYLYYLFIRTELPTDRKLVWAATLVIGHVFVMPVFWYLLIWKPRKYLPLQPNSRFSLLVFGPLMIVLLVPLTFLLPFTLLFTPALINGDAPLQIGELLGAWVWVVAPLLGAATIYWIGRWGYAAFTNLPSRLAAWAFLWGVFSLIAVPVIWYAIAVLRGLVPTDADPNTLSELAEIIPILALLLQPFVLVWLFMASRIFLTINLTSSQTIRT